MTADQSFSLNNAKQKTLIRALLNRFVMTPLILLIVGAGWDFYATTHDDGIVTGRIIDAAGKPVAGADVVLWVYNFATYVEKTHVTSDAAGQFAFTDNPSHRIGISASKPGVGIADRRIVRLYFRAENTNLAQPLVLHES